jgi:hypothetical protein
MGSPTGTSAADEDPGPLTRPGATGVRVTPATAAATGDDAVDVASYSYERPSRCSWPSEAPPTGMLTAVLGEAAFYYEACWLHYRSSAQRRGE